MGKLKYDKERLDFVEEKYSFGHYLLKILTFLFFTALLVIVYYLIFSLTFSTKEQKKMVAETKMMKQEYDKLVRQGDLLEGVVSELQSKDEQIYRKIFNSNIPDFAFSSDTINLSNFIKSQRKDLINYTEARTKELTQLVSYSDSILNELLISMENENVLTMLEGVPSILPIANFPLQNIGASMGKKMHPFYKSVVFHSGLDFIAPLGTEVVATAPGVVKSVVRSKSSQGTMIVLDHKNGYKTTYSHLSDVLVRIGGHVKGGDVIARVGNSGASFAPHLHYEVTYNGEYLDPLNFFMGELDIDQYREIILVSVNTGQSLD